MCIGRQDGGGGGVCGNSAEKKKNKSTADYSRAQSNRLGGHCQAFLPCKIAVNFRNVQQLSITQQKVVRKVPRDGGRTLRRRKQSTHKSVVIFKMLLRVAQGLVECCFSIIDR